MNAKISVFGTCVEVIIYLLCNLHDCTFKRFVITLKTVFLEHLKEQLAGNLLYFRTKVDLF